MTLEGTGSSRSCCTSRGRRRDGGHSPEGKARLGVTPGDLGGGFFEIPAEMSNQGSWQDGTAQTLLQGAGTALPPAPKS